MLLTLLGTGSPAPMIERGGTSVALTVDDEPILVDCGPRTVLRLLEAGIDPGDIETLFFTHHHIDHNADIFQFIIGGWSLGRGSLDIFGPEGTEDYLEALHHLYEEDIAYRRWFRGDGDGIDRIETTQVTEGFEVSTDTVSVTALPVEHSIETFAYRFKELETGETCVVSGDTRRIEELERFAEGADVLVQDCCIAPPAKNPKVERVFRERHTRPMDEESRQKHKENHCDPRDAGLIADAAGVDTLVLTHLLPYRDHEAMRGSARSAFDGDIVVAEDGMTLEV